MRIIELVEFVNDNKYKAMKAEQLQTVLSKKLETKEYISFKEKKQLVNDIVNQCILYEDGIFKFDDMEQYVCFTMYTIAAYTNIELSDDIEDDYDVLCREQLLNVVIDTFICEYENVKTMLRMKCDYILSSNNLESQVGKFLSDLLEKIDGISTILGNKVESFSFDKLSIDQKTLEKVLNLVSN